MKNILIPILVFTLLMASAPVMAQKFGHINTVELLELMPEVKTTDIQLQKYQAQLEEQNQAMLKEYEIKVAEFQVKESIYIESVKEVKIKEIQDLEARIQAFRVSAAEKLTTKKEELYTPIFDKAKNIIKEVAKEKGYSYVFDTSLGMLLVQPDSDDILPAVKKKLGI